MLITKDLIALIERSEAARLKHAANLSGGEFLEIGGGVASFCGADNPLTACVSVGVDEAVSSEQFAQILEFYDSRTKLFEFKLSPLSPLDLREWVVREAKSLPEMESLLIKDLTDFEGECDFDIREISPDETDEYAKRCMRRFFAGSEIPNGLVDVVASCCVSDDSSSYEIWMDGIPVAGCGLGFAPGIAWLQGASVEPEYRRKGLHKAMQIHRMKVAKDQGYTLIVQGAQPGSQSQLNAQKNGFVIAFTRPSFML